MPYPPEGGTGGGGGFVLGNTPNTFADIAARNSQASSDAVWLASYDANKSLVVRVGSGTSFDYYRRPISPTGTDDWEDVTEIVTGPPGADGTANVPNLTEGQVVVGGSTPGTLAASSITETADRV